jgi:hypothetical protein
MYLSLEHLQEFDKTTPYLNFLAKRKKVFSNSFVKELLKNKKLSNLLLNS